MHRYAAALLPLCLPAGAVSTGAGAIAAPVAVTVTRAAAMASITGDARYFTGAVHVDAMFQRTRQLRVAAAHAGWPCGNRARRG